MQLKFNHCCFYTGDIEAMTTEEVTTFGEVGAVVIFGVRLKDGQYFQISPYNVISPSGVTEDIHYRDKDESWSFLLEIRKIQHDSFARWYRSAAAKEFALRHGIPVEERP